MKLLELFAGSCSVGKVAKVIGYEVFSTDIVSMEGIDYIINFLDFDVTKVPFIPDVIWASPPCTAFSIAGWHYHFERKGKYNFVPKSEVASTGILLIHKTIEVISYFLAQNPALKFYIENPRGLLRGFDFMQTQNLFKNTILKRRLTITQCQYGGEFQKPTDIWTNDLAWKPKPICKRKSPCHLSGKIILKSGKKASSFSAKYQMGSYDRAKIPAQLSEEIMQLNKIQKTTF